jgi:glycosyltransferase involved in cell wall biosynthesis
VTQSRLALGSVRVSVIIPVRNTERYLEQAIESALGQTLPPAEVLIVDDGSTDRSLDVARSFGERVAVLDGAHGGIGATRNAGVERARGNFLAFLDADDYWAAEKLAWQIELFAGNPSLDLVFGQVRQFYSPDVAVPGEERARMEQSVFDGHHAGTMLVKRESFARVGPFNPRVRVGEFLDWYARATEAGVRTAAVPGVVMFRRIHDQNTVTRYRASQTDYAKILKAALDRRRKREATAPSEKDPSGV